MAPRPTADSGAILQGVVNNAQIPHQPLCIITDSPTFSGLPVFREMISRAVRRSEQTTLVSILHPPQTLLPLDSGSSARSNTKVVDLTESVAGYADSECDALAEIRDKVLSSYTGGQIFIDALDILAEDHSPSSVLSLSRSILAAVKKAKAPSRLVLLLPPNSPFYAHLVPPTFSSTLTLLTPHPPSLVEHLSKSYLSPISPTPSPNLWMILENGARRAVGPGLAYDGQGAEVDPNWLRDGRSIVAVLVRKPTGGIKGISRSLEGVRVDSSCPSSSSEDGTRMTIIPLGEMVDLNPFSQPLSTEVTGERPITSHAELDLPFNLSLTETQRKRRAEVPIPYAHEGEGASGDLIWAEEEDEDDEEI